MVFVRPAKKASPKGQIKAAPAQTYSFPAPIRGLVLNESIAMPTPGSARVLDNWICTTTGIKARGGTSAHVPLPAPVKTLFTYRSGGVENMFAATSSDIYEVTASSLVTPAVVVSGQTSGEYSTTQFGTAGGDFLYAVNGTDDAQLFDGGVWQAVNDVSTLAITGVATADLSFVWAFASRLFFIEKDTLNAWYLPVDSIAGAAQQFSLAGIFQGGGSLLFGATWSLDAGDGLDDKCVFVSDQGEVAIYEGTNPGDAGSWSKAGVYYITAPLGPKGKMQAGGDLLIATQTGLVPISQAIQRDAAALEMGAVSKNITPLWQEKASVLGGGNWEIEKWPSQNIMIVSQPGDTESTCLVANLQTGAWSRFTGLNVQCMTFFDGSVFFGGYDGKVYRFEVGGSDSGQIYTCAYLGQHDGMGLAGVQKTIAQARTTFRLSTAIIPVVTVTTNYSTTLSLPPSAAPDNVGDAVWGLAQWGDAKWGGGAIANTQALWTSVGRTGYAIAPEVQITFGNIAKPDVELVAIDMTFHTGALVT